MGCLSGQERRQSDVNKVDRGENSLCSKNARNRRGHQHSTSGSMSGLKYMTMLAIGYPILFMNVWAGLLEKST